MKLHKASTEILKFDSKSIVLEHLEHAGRVCYKSEDKIKETSAETFIRTVIKLGHESVIEHAGATVKFICDRGVSHELVRHRLSSFSQESTRYANYSKDKFGRECHFIIPLFWKYESFAYSVWEEAMQRAENAYMDLINKGSSAQKARTVLPNSLKTEVIMSCNFRQWRTIFKQRCSPKAHPQMREVMIPLLLKFKERIPVLFEDL